MIHTAGDWSLSERGVYFLAASSAASQLRESWAAPVEEGEPSIRTESALMHRWLLVAVNEINAATETMMDALCALGARWFIDSGIFNLTNAHMRAHDITMDEALALAPEEIDGFDALFEKYVALVRRWENRCWGYIELDQGGRENKIKTRTRLEALGLRPIPVYHPLNDGWDYFDYLAERYDRICFGNIVQAGQTTRKRLIGTAWERRRKYPHLWIHLLGLTPNTTLNAYPIDSADSSSWMAAWRFVQGLETKTLLKTFDSIPKNFRYVLGNAKEPGAEYDKAISMSGYSCALDFRGWGHHLDALRKAGFELWPHP